MLNKPKFMSPSVNMYGNSVIDLNSDTLPFSCIVDGNEAVTDFQIVVSRLSDNATVFNTGMQTLEKPFSPINNRNQNVVFSIDLKDYFATISNGEEYTKAPLILNTNSTYNGSTAYYVRNEENDEYSAYAFTTSDAFNADYSSLYVESFVNSADMYYWTIDFKGKSGTEVYSTTEGFFANSTPDTAICYSYDDSFENTSNNFTNLQSRKIYFKSTYNQSEGISLKRYGWRLTDTTNNVVVMDTITQNQIYGVTDDISCVCNGLVNQTSYRLELYVETQNGFFGILQSIDFDIDYTVKNVDLDFEVEALSNTSGIMLSWKNLKTTEGVVEGEAVSYTDNFPLPYSSSIEIPENSSVVFSKNANGKELKIDENSYVVISFGIDKTKDVTLLEMSGIDDSLNVLTRRLEYTASDRELTYTISSGEAVSVYKEILSGTIGELCWYVVTLHPLIDGVANYKLVESISEEGLFPAEDLYPIAEDDVPEELLYPDFGQWNVLRSGVD